MIPKSIFVDNLAVCDTIRNVKGCVVECGVWRGGMSAAIAEILGKDRTYYLFDSFEGLPEAKEVDGETARIWQNDKDSPTYFDNCSAEIAFAQKAMDSSQAKDFNIVKGWFSDTLPLFDTQEKIALLRLDGDWYDSTMDCLVNLFPKVAPGGMIIIDDYYAWDGCARAVHDYLSENKLAVRIRQSQAGVCYITNP